MTDHSDRMLIRTGIAMAMLFTAGLATGLRPAASATTDWVANPTFASSATAWSISPYAALERRTWADYTYGQLTSIHPSHTHTVSMRSNVSAGTLSSGSRLNISMKISTPDPVVSVVVEAREVTSSGNVVAVKSWSSSQNTTSWRLVELRLDARGTGNRFDMRIVGHSLTGGQRVRVRDITATLGTSTGPTPTPSASPSNPPPGGVRPCTAAQLGQLATRGAVAFADEFNGTSVDPSRWRTRNETTLSFDQARIMARNVSVRDGLLSITARRESIKGRSYTTGYLDTIGIFSRKFGRWEIRAKVPTAPGISRGLWPAFWLRADQQYGEIDVMEAWGDPNSRGESLVNSYAWTLHENTNSPPGSQRHHGWGHHDAPLADAFHVWAVDWSPACLKFSMDGRTIGSVATESAPWLVSSLAGPVNIRLNMQVGNSYWGYADASRAEQTRLPASFLVDYVRVYQPGG